MLFPYNNYLKYLMCLGTDNESIVQNMTSMGFVPPSPEYLDWYRTVREPLISEAIKLSAGNGKKDTDVWLAEKLGVYPLLKCKRGKGTDEEKVVFSEANAILKDGQLRNVVEALLLKKFEPVIISQLLGTNHMFMASAEAIAWYRNYYWNTIDVPAEDWKEYLDKIGDDRDKYIRVIALYSNPEYVKWKIGLDAKVKYADMLRIMASGLFFKFTELIRSDNVDTIVKAASIARITAELGEKSKGLEDTEGKSMLNEVQYQLKFIEDDTPLLSIEEVKENKK